MMTRYRLEVLRALARLEDRHGNVGDPPAYFTAASIARELVGTQTASSVQRILVRLELDPRASHVARDRGRGCTPDLWALTSHGRDTLVEADRA